MLEGRDAIQVDLDRLEWWSCENFKMFNYANYKVLHTGYRTTEWLWLKGTSWDHLVQPICFKQGHLEHTVQNHIQVGFQYLQRKRLYNLSGQPVSSALLPSQWKSFFACADGTSLVSVWACCLVSYCLAPSCWFPPFRYLYTLIRCPLSLFQDKQSEFSQPCVIGEMLWPFNQSQTWMLAGLRVYREQPCRELGGIGQYKTEHKPAVCACNPKRQLHQKKHDQLVEGGDCVALLHSHETLGRVLGSSVGLLQQERWGLLEWVWRRALRMIRGLEHVSRRGAERVGIVQPGEDSRHTSPRPLST